MADEKDDKPGNTPEPESKPDAAAAAIENKIEAVAEKIDDTPKEDQDKEWRTAVNSSLAEISAALRELKADRGQSADVVAMTQAVKDLTAQVASLQKPTVHPSGNAGDAPPSPETPTATSSEKVAPPVAEQKKEAEPETPARRKVRSWI